MLDYVLLGTQKKNFLDSVVYRRATATVYGLSLNDSSSLSGRVQQQKKKYQYTLAKSQSKGKEGQPKREG